MSVVDDLPEVGMKTIFHDIFKYKTAFEYCLCLIELTCLHMETVSQYSKWRLNMFQNEVVVYLSYMYVFYHLMNLLLSYFSSIINKNLICVGKRHLFR